MAQRLVLLVSLLLLAPALAHAEGRALDSVDDVHDACNGVRERVTQRLYVLEVQDGWRFGALEEGQLVVDTGRNFRALDGRVSLLVPPAERLGFEATAERAERLRAADARLRVGFFLGFDDRGRQPCLVRNRFATTIVRADVAYIELVDADGARVARADTDRLRAWADDQEALAIEGEGPRGAVDAASFANGTAAPERWQAALSAPSVRARIGRCHAAGVERGAAREGQAVIRLNVESHTGQIRRADVALSSLGDRDEAVCLSQALGAVTLSRGPTGWQAEFVDLSVPVRVVAD